MAWPNSTARLFWVGAASQPFLLDPEVDSIAVGRGPQNVLVIPDEHASELHALLEREGTRWLLRDVSRHGTEVCSGNRGWRKMEGGSKRLGHGDLVRFGSTVLRFDVASVEAKGLVLTPAPEPPVYMRKRLKEVLDALAKPLIDGYGAAPASNGEICLALGIKMNTLREYLGELYRLFAIGEDAGTAHQRRALLAAQWDRARIEGVD